MTGSQAITNGDGPFGLAFPPSSPARPEHFAGPVGVGVGVNPGAWASSQVSLP